MPRKKNGSDSTATLSRADELSIAGAALCDPRTVRRAIAGEHVQPMTRERIATALRARGFEHLLPKDNGRSRT